jgi:hypothetical protein
MKYAVRVDEKGHTFVLYSDPAIKLFNKVVYNNDNEDSQVVECLITDNELSQKIIKQLDEL